MTTKKDLIEINKALIAICNAACAICDYPDYKDDVESLMCESANAVLEIDMLMADNPEHLPVRKSTEVFNDGVEIIKEGDQIFKNLLPKVDEDIRIEKFLNNKKMLERCWKDDHNG